jgi:SoxY-related AACIE arm protein
MFEAAADGEIKALWIACTNPAQSMPDQATVRRALQRAEFVVVQEAFATTSTCEYADLLLPAPTWGEKEGTVTNSERRISRVRAAIGKPGSARHDWEIVVDFARRLESRLPAVTPSAPWGEGGGEGQRRENLPLTPALSRKPERAPGRDREQEQDGVRRRLLQAGAALVAQVLVRPAAAQDSAVLAPVIAQFAAGQPVRAGRVKLEIAPLVDNGNVVPMRVTVDSPMSATDHVREIAVFNEKNPQRDVARFALSPRNGRAEVSTRIRLATSQKLVALARMSDGSVWSDSADVIVVLAACIEPENS